ncbi:MAG: glycosyltransferase family 4 protein [bacterium]
MEAKEVIRSAPSKGLRVVVATGIFPPQSGGPATYSKLLVNRLPEFGHIVTVVNFGSVLHWPKGIRHVLYFAKLFTAGLGADVIYAQDPVSVGLPAKLVAQILWKPFLLKIVGDYAWEQGSQRYGITDPLDDFAFKNGKTDVQADGTQYPFAVRVLKQIQLGVALAADTVVVPSEYLKRIVTAWGVPAEKITVIYNGFELSRVAKVPAKHLNLGAHSIVSVGRLVPWKGFSTLIEVVGMLAKEKEYADVHLYILGDGPDRGVLEKRAMELGAPVTFLGKAEHAIVFQYLASAKVFVLNTAYEGFSHLLLEALAMGVPVITTPVGGNVELIVDGENGLLVPQGDMTAFIGAIKRIFNEEHLVAKLSMAGKARVAQFSDERMLKELQKTLKSFVK